MDEDGRYTTDLITEEAIRIIRAGAASGQPFLLSVNYNAPHTPLAAPSRCSEGLEDIVNERRRIYTAVVRCLDEAIGQVVDVLDGDAPAAERELFSYVGPNLITGPDGPEQTALQRGPWKLVRIGPGLLDHPADAGTIELFAIESDPDETTNLAADHPDVVASMLDRIRELRALQPPDVGLAPLSPPPGWSAPPLWRIPDD